MEFVAVEPAAEPSCGRTSVPASTCEEGTGGFSLCTTPLPNVLAGYAGTVRERIAACPRVPQPEQAQADLKLAETIRHGINVNVIPTAPFLVVPVSSETARVRAHRLA